MKPLIEIKDCYPVRPRAIGRAIVSAKARQGASYLNNLRQEGSLRCLLPRAASARLDAVFLNTSGGITGGDVFSISAEAEEKAALSITTQAAERVYEALPGEIGRLDVTLKAGPNASMIWAPQETILFNGSSLDRRLDVDLATSSRFVMVEPLVFGRLQSGEQVTNATFYDRVRIRRNSGPIYNDGVRLTGNIAETLNRPAVANGARAMASAVLVGPDAQKCHTLIANHLPESAGASLLADDILAIRVLAHDSFELRKTLLPILDILTQGAVPKNWKL